MPEIIFKADQGAGVRKIIRIMQGDTRSHVIRFVVPRYDSGVDLAPLVWYIKFVDAEGVSDIALPSAMYEVTADDIRVRWTVNGISTDAAGNTKFQLHGVGNDAEDHVISWTSGAGEIEVTENIGFEVSDEDEEELTALDELIVFVQGELNGVIAAGNNAAAAATAANSAAARAEAAAEGAVDATAAAIRANEAAEAAENAAANANNVMDVKANALAATAEGNPVQIHPDGGSLLKPVLAFDPVQPGSGDPYPAGGGKNLLENTATTQTVNGVTFTVNADGSITVSGTATADAYLDIGAADLEPGSYILNGCPANGHGGFIYGSYTTGSAYYDYGSGVTISNDTKQRFSVGMKVNNGSNVPNITFYPMIRLVSIADATYQPYSNIRPITGRTGTVLGRAGKNLLPKLEPHSGSLNGLSYIIADDGTVTVSGTTTANVNIPIHGTYASVENVFPGLRSKELFALNVTVRITNPETGANRYTGGAITLADDEFISYVYMTWPSGSTYSGQKYYPSITLGHAAPAFEPYQGDTFTLDFGQTVYGGTLDWIKGELITPDNRARAFDGTEGWNKASAANTFYLDYYNSGGNAGSPHLMEAISSHYKTAASTALGSEDMTYYPLSYTGAIYRHAFTDSRFSTVAEWKAYLSEQAAAGTPVQAIEKLPTPTTAQLAPQQITAQAGMNTVYSDADGMTVHYNKSLNAAFEELKNAILAMGGNV